jgi:hypothetical protein
MSTVAEAGIASVSLETVSILCEPAGLSLRDGASTIVVPGGSLGATGLLVPVLA